MEFLNSWLQGIIIAVIVSTIIEMILPNGNNKKYIKVVLGIYVVFNIITPIINQFFDSDFELSSLFRMEEYAKKIEEYQVDTKTIQESNIIQEVYVSNLKKDIEEKLKEKGYQTKQIEIEMENKETYAIQKIILSLIKAKEKEEKKGNIKKIETVTIQIGQEKEEKQEQTLTEHEKQELKQYFLSTYQISEEQIQIN